MQDNSFVKAGSNLSVRKGQWIQVHETIYRRAWPYPVRMWFTKFFQLWMYLTANCRQRNYVKEGKICQTWSKPFKALDSRTVSPRQNTLSLKYSFQNNTSSQTVYYLRWRLSRSRDLDRLSRDLDLLSLSRDLDRDRRLRLCLFSLVSPSKSSFSL